MTFKNNAQRISAYVDSPHTQMRYKISGVTGPKFTKPNLYRSNFFIDGVNATIHVAIRPFVVE